MWKIALGFLFGFGAFAASINHHWQPEGVMKKHCDSYFKQSNDERRE